MIEPRKVRRGEPIRAEHFNSLWDYLHAIGLRVVSPLRLLKTVSGSVLTADSDGLRPIWGKTLGAGQSGAVYPWVQQLRQADHTWKDGPLKSTQDGSGNVIADGLYEVNGNLTVPVGTIVEIWQDLPNTDFLTQADRCV